MTMEVKEREEEVQLEIEFFFGVQYSDMHIKEAVRGLKAITKELVRFGVSLDSAERIVDLIAKENPVVGRAAEIIEEQLDNAK